MPKNLKKSAEASVLWNNLTALILVLLFATIPVKLELLDHL
jgi:hypothetical protein